MVGWLAPEPGTMTVLYGDGGSGKGTLAAYWASLVLDMGGTVAIVDAEGHPREWARRIGGLLGRPLAHGQVTILHTSGVLALEELEGLVDLVIVDSAAYFQGDGTGHDEWARSATHVQEVARDIGIPLLVLAHVAKGSPDKAYGSGFWHNAARVSFHLAMSADGSVMLTCRKATDVEGLTRGAQWEVGVTLAGVVPTDMTLEAYAPSPVEVAPQPTRAERILQALDDEGGEVSVAEVAQATNIHRTDVSRNLRALEEGGRVRRTPGSKPGRWSVV